MHGTTWIRRRLRTIPGWGVEVALVSLLPVLAILRILTGRSSDFRGEALAYGLGLAVAVVLLLRRNAPRLTRRMAEWLAGIPPWAIDVSIAVVAGVMSVYRISIAATPGGTRPDALAYGLAVGMAVALLARRRWPLAMLVCVFVLWVAYHTAEYPGGAPAPALWVAMFTAGAAERQRGALLVTAMSVIGSDLAARTRYDGVPLLDTSLDSSTMVLLAALLLGELVHGRRAWWRRAELDRRLEGERRVAEERLRIARELHDVMAHTIAVITVQAGVAAEMMERPPDQSTAALAAIRNASREAMAELRATIGVLRQPDAGAAGATPLHGDGVAAGRSAAPSAPAPGLAQLDDLVGMAAGAGLSVDLGVDGHARPLPAAVDLTAYRIVQESLTNVLRHARATAVAVRIGYQPGGMVVEISDNGQGPTGTGGPGGPDAKSNGGHGLMGMRERAAAVGGRLEAGPAPSNGFMVRAWLPTPGRPP